MHYDDMTPDDAARLFAESLPTIRSIIHRLAWRAGLSRERRAEFGAWAIARLVDDSYALVRQFGVVNFSTYLAVTLSAWLGEFVGQVPPGVAHEPHATRNRIDRSLGARVRGLSAEGGASPLGALLTQVLCVGAVVGTARFESIEGLAYARFSSAPGYEMIADAARAVGTWLVGRRFWPSDSGDFASGLAALWSAPPLSLVDAFGRDLGATSVIVAGGWVIADFRADGTRVPASLRRPDGSDHDAEDAEDAKGANDAKDANARPAA